MKSRKLIFLLSGLVLSLIIFIMIWRLLFGTGIEVSKTAKVIYIPTGSSWLQVKDSLNAHLTIKDPKVFDWVVQKKNYPLHIKPGRYVIDNGYKLYKPGKYAYGPAGKLRLKSPLDLYGTLNNLAGKVGGQIEADSAELMAFLS